MWRPQILVKRHVELMMGGIGACGRLSRAPCGRAPSMPSESDVIRRMITAMGTLMIEWPALPPSAPPIFHLHPQHTKQLLMMRIIHRAGAVFNSQLSQQQRKRCSCCCVLTSTICPHHHRTHTAPDTVPQTHLALSVTAVSVTYKL